MGGNYYLEEFLDEASSFWLMIISLWTSIAVTSPDSLAFPSSYSLLMLFGAYLSDQSREVLSVMLSFMLLYLSIKSNKIKALCSFSE